MIRLPLKIHKKKYNLLDKVSLDEKGRQRPRHRCLDRYKSKKASTKIGQVISGYNLVTSVHFFSLGGFYKGFKEEHYFDNDLWSKC